MKFLLTSGGITNDAIASALIDLVGKSPAETALVFITTAANAEEGDKSWLIENLSNLKRMGYKTLDIVDIAGLPQELWQKRLASADVLFFSGGAVIHLMKWIRKSGLAESLPDLLKTRVYAGISAGSMIVGKKVVSHAQQLYSEETGVLEDIDGLSLVGLTFKPHLHSDFFPLVRRENVEKLATIIDGPLYALDDECALKVVDSKVEVIGGGEYLIFNKDWADPLALPHSKQASSQP